MVVKNTWKILIAGALLAGCGNEPESTGTEETAETRSGAKIYENHCVVCHGADGKLGAAGAKDLSISELDSAAIIHILKNGKNGMPRQDRFIKSEEEYENLIDHIKSLRK